MLTSQGSRKITMRGNVPESPAMSVYFPHCKDSRGPTRSPLVIRGHSTDAPEPLWRQSFHHPLRVLKHLHLPCMHGQSNITPWGDLVTRGSFVITVTLFSEHTHMIRDIIHHRHQSSETFKDVLQKRGHRNEGLGVVRG